MALLFPGPQFTQSREQIFSEISNPSANVGDTVEISIGPTNTGPWTLANVTSVSCNPQPNPATPGLAFPGSGAYIAGLSPNTTYFVKWSILAGSPDPPEDLVVGPVTTYGFPAFVCIPNGVGSNEASILEGSNLPNGRADLGPTICKRDHYILRYGTVSGGPYPNQVAGNFTSYSPQPLITGLAPKTTYYTVFEAYEEGSVVPYFVGSECSFTTTQTSCGFNVGASWDVVEYGYPGGYGHSFIQAYPPGTGSSV